MRTRLRLDLMFLAVVLGVVSWFAVSFEERVASTTELKLEFTGQPPEELVIRRDGVPDRVTMVVVGPRSLVRNFDASKQGYPVDVSDLRVGENVMVFESDAVSLPSGLTVLEFEPQRMTLTAEEALEKIVPVEVRWSGPLDDGWLLKETVISPNQVRVRGAKSLVEQLDSLPTLDVQLTEATPSLYEGTVNLNLPGEVEARPAQVQVLLAFGPKVAEVWVEVPLAVRPALPAGATLANKTVELKVTAPLNLVSQNQLAQNIIAALPVPQNLEPGENELPFTVELPQHTTLLETKPQTIRIYVPAPAQEGP